MFYVDVKRVNLLFHKLIVNERVAQLILTCSKESSEPSSRLTVVDHSIGSIYKLYISVTSCFVLKVPQVSLRCLGFIPLIWM